LTHTIGVVRYAINLYRKYCLLGQTLKESVKSINIWCKDMNNFSGFVLGLNIWPILYDSIVFLCLQTPELYLKLNRI